MSIKWHGRAVEKGIHNKVAANIAKAVIAIEADAKRICPVDSGRLRASISHHVDEQELTGRVGTDTEYAPYVFLGTRFMTAHPTLRPALEKNRGYIKSLFRSTTPA